MKGKTTNTQRPNAVSKNAPVPKAKGGGKMKKGC